jgi:PAS domain S-box-containing protein
MAEEKRSEAFDEQALFAIMTQAEGLARVGGWEWDICSDTWTCSENWLRLHGCSNRHPKTEDLLTIAHPDDRDRIRGAFGRAVSEGVDYEIEHRIIRPDTGEERIIRALGRPELDRDGKAVKLFGSVQDVTEQRKTEDELRRTKILLEASIESPQDLIVLSLDREYRYLYFNTTHAEIMRLVYDAHIGIGDRIFEYMAVEEDIERAKSHYDRALAGEGHVAIDQYGDGHLRSTYEVRYSPIHTGARKIIGLTVYAQDITDRKQNEKLLEQSNTDLRLAQRIASIGTWTLDPEIGVPQWTEEVYRIYERDPKLGPHPLADYKKIYRGQSWERFNNAIQGAIRDGTPYDIELRLDLPSGNVKWVQAICEPETEVGPKGRRLRGTIQDITARKQAELKIRESEEKLKQAQALGKIGNWEFDVASKRITWSEEVFRLFERDPSQGPPDFEENMAYYHKEDAERLQEQVRIAVEKGITAEDDYRVTLPSGRSVWQHGKIFKETDEQGRTVRLLGTVQDITDRKLLEQSLEIERKRLSMLLEAFPGFIYLQASDHTVRFANEYFVKQFGDPRNKPCHKVLWKRDTPCEPCRTFQVFETKSPQVWEWANTPNGRTYTIYDYPFIDVDGTELVLEIGIDITEKSLLQKQLQQAQKMEAVGNLAGGIAHEFNNVLGIIMGNAELAMDDVPDWNPAKECLREIRTASFRAKEVVRQILSFARKTTTALKPLELNAIVRESLKLMRASIPAMIDIQQDIPSEPKTILGDPTEIHQIAINLCTNASHAMKDTGGVLKVGVSEVMLDERSASRYEDLLPGDFVRLTVKDNGEGIAPDVLEKVFEPYFTTKEFGAGSGMGLAVVYGIVKKCRGAIRIDSALGAGTTVEVLFPKIEGSVPNKESEESKLPTGNEKILLVDDDPSIVTAVREMLERVGYSVAGISDSESALERFRSAPDEFDLVITDMAMPKMSGDVLAAELSRLRKAVPILLCTGHSDTVDEEKARELGVRGIVMKPLDKGTLARVVRQALDAT